jgi:rhamnogalacturonan endolyase
MNTLFKAFIVVVALHLLGSASAYAAFGYTDSGTGYVVDSGAGLVFEVRKTDGTITSIVFNGTEYNGPSGKGSHIASGLGTPTTVTPSTDGSTYVKITLQTDSTNGVVSSLTHYLIVRNGDNRIYMATYATAEPDVGELRWITRLNAALIPNGPTPSDLDDNTGAIESSDVFGLADGTTRSKYYGDMATHGKDRAMDLTYCGATGPGIGCWMVFGNRESSSGGPFFRDIQNQQGGDQEIYNYMNSGHNQTESNRLNVLHGPYVLVFTTGAAPTLPVDFSWMGSLGLTGWVSASERGAVSGTVTGIPAGFQTVVGFASGSAQYWATASGGNYSCPAMKPGSYTATLYKGELAVATSPVTVAAGSTTPLNLVSAEPAPSAIFRIGEWDGTPAGFLNADKIVEMHPQDVRMDPWTATSYTVGVDDPSSFPAIQFRGANSPTKIRFNLAANQIVNLTVRIGITCAYNSGRPQITLNSFTSAVPAASTQPSSRSFTIGTYRGNNALFTYAVPASALVVGANTLSITPASGSSDLGTWLSAGWVYDAVELDGPVATPTIDYVGSDPLTIGGLAEPFRNIALTLDGGTAARNTIAAASGAWSIIYDTALSAGSHTFVAVASDDAGHSSPGSTPFSINTSIAMPAIVNAIGDTGTYTDGASTSDRVFSFTGTAGAGNAVTITRMGTGVIGTVTADVNGQWSFNYTSVSLPDGANRFYATASNGAGNSASSSFFTLQLEGVPRISIVRQNPAFEAIPNTIESVIYRVTFNHPVSGVTTGAFNVVSTDSAAGSIASVSAASGTTFDVAVNALSGTGSIGIILLTNSGVVDGEGHPESGYTAGQTYTLLVPTTGNGVWIQPASGGSWSEPLNWMNAVVADGDSSSANFNTLDLSADTTVRLDSSRTLNSITFGDTDVASSGSWLLDNNHVAANTLTFAGSTPTVSVNALGAGASVTISAALSGSSGLTKAGAGNLVLSAANPLTGALNVTGGSLQLAPGGSLNLGNNDVSTALNTRLNVVGGSFTTGGTVIALTSSFVIDSGTASLGAFRTNSDFGSTLRANGGTLTVGDVNIRRNSGAAADFASGFIVTGDAVATATTVGLGTQNSTGAMSIEQNGSLTVSGPLTVGNQLTGGRGGALRVLNNGIFTSLDTDLGVLMCRNNGANANNVASATFTGGVSTVEKFTLGFDATVTAGSATITVNGGTLYLGAGGIVKKGAAGLVTNLNFGSGTIGAKAAWSTALPINLPNGGNIAFKAANAAGEPVDITLDGVLAGAGGFTKTGSGALNLTATNTFTGSVNLLEGSLRVSGALAAGGAVTLNGGTLTGAGTINKPVVLNAATFAANGAHFVLGNSLTWNGGGQLAFHIDGNGVSGNLALTGALLKGSAGAYSITLTPGAGFVAGNTYTLATFASTDFSAADFSASGLPPGYVAIFSVSDTRLTVTVKLVAAVAFADLRQFYDGTPRIPTVMTDPARLNVVLTYDGNRTAPVFPGTYAVVGTIDEPSYVGSVSGNLIVSATALVRHAPVISGGVDGAVQMMSSENLKLTGDISNDLLVRGTPQIRVNGHPAYAGVQDADGVATPSNYTITLNGGAVVRYVVRRVDPPEMPVVTPPATPTGTRNVTLKSPGQSAGDFNTLKNLTLGGSAGEVAIPPGIYGDFVANDGNGFILGEAGSADPVVYELESMKLSAGATLQVVGPVLLKLHDSLTLAGTAGSAAQPRWLVIQISNGGLTLNLGATLHGEVIAPAGTVTIGENATLDGNLSADKLTINNDGLLHEAAP